MGLSLVRSRALLGLDARPVQVEVHLANGLPSFTLVGLADTEVKEARERVRSAIANAGLEFPSNKRITVNLAPADLPKDSGRFDLPIALGILAASGQIDAAALAPWVFAGELSLGGELRAVRGALPMALALSQDGGAAPWLVLPPGSAEEAALVPGVRVIRARHLLDVVARFRREGEPPADDGGWVRLEPRTPVLVADGPDLADVKGQAAARRALEIAAAGGHSLLMVGPPGAGKSMLAQRLPGLLPPMSTDEALASAAVASLAGRLDLSRWGQRPLTAPHHTASAVALVGGGSPPRPGEISLAHHGVLFLDELPEFPRHALEALREPLETGRIRISRAARQTDCPASFQLVAAMNPCPCGYFGDPQRSCGYSCEKARRYQAKLSGPLLDRIDLHLEVAAVKPDELLSLAPGEASAPVRERVRQTRQRQIARQGKLNQDLRVNELEPVLDQHGRWLSQAMQRMALSARSLHRTLRVARTLADMSGDEQISTAHLAEALSYRLSPP